MSNLTALDEFEQLINRSSVQAMILGLMITKGMVGRQNQYKFVVNSDDHRPPHVHISLNNQQIAKYNLLTGERIESRYPKLDKLFADWFASSENQGRARNEWEKFHGPINAIPEGA